MSTTTMNLVTEKPDQQAAETLTETLQSQLSNPVSTPDFDLHGSVNEVLKDVGLTTAYSGGKLTFYGQDPIIPSPHRFGAMAAIAWQPGAWPLLRFGKRKLAKVKTFTSTFERLFGASLGFSKGNGKR